MDFLTISSVSSAPALAELISSDLIFLLRRRLEIAAIVFVQLWIMYAAKGKLLLTSCLLFNNHGLGGREEQFKIL